MLEVLVACGILVIGLTSIASILPAATARLREAATQDRAASMAASALCEFESRNLAFRGLFITAISSTTTYLSQYRAVGFGEVLRDVPTTGAVQAVSGTAPSLLFERIDNSPTSSDNRRGFFLEDELQYVSGAGPLPLNSFVGGLRDFRRNVCWGALVEPYPWDSDPNPGAANPMRAVRATVAVFRKPGRIQRITLTGSAGGIFTAPLDDASRKAFVNGCMPVLAVPAVLASPPQWLIVNSSWTQSAPPASPITNVVFRDSPSIYAGIVGSGTLQLLCFENILSITQQTYTIE